VFVNTSDIEGFPNSYLQSWIRGVPVVTLLDPDGVIEREGLGAAVSSPAEMRDGIRRLLDDPAAWKAASDRCCAFMARERGEDSVLAAYLKTFEDVMRSDAANAKMIGSSEARHV
jgi:glycosyltransferase involved in cell wall biosynthesis